MNALTHAIVHATDLDWRDSGDADPKSRLTAIVEIAGCDLHLEAYAVSWRAGEQLFSGDYGDTPDDVYAAVGGCEAWDTVAINGREYVLIATPFCNSTRPAEFADVDDGDYLAARIDARDDIPDAILDEVDQHDLGDEDEPAQEKP